MTVVSRCPAVSVVGHGVRSHGRTDGQGRERDGQHGLRYTRVGNGHRSRPWSDCGHRGEGVHREVGGSRRVGEGRGGSPRHPKESSRTDRRDGVAKRTSTPVSDGGGADTSPRGRTPRQVVDGHGRRRDPKGTLGDGGQPESGPVRTHTHRPCLVSNPTVTPHPAPRELLQSVIREGDSPPLGEDEEGGLTKIKLPIHPGQTMGSGEICY